jgi:hypothetical protein
MTPAGPTIISLLAAALYGGVAVICLMALVSSLSQRQAMWHAVGWGAVILFFVGLVLLRVWNVEELLREELRLSLYAKGSYDDRRAIQGPLFAGIFGTAALIGGFAVFQVSRTISGRRNIAVVMAFGGVGAMIFLVLLRIVSLHSVDELLYGPLKLNWVADIGSALLVLASAVYYRLVVSGKAGPRVVTKPSGPAQRGR